MSCSRLLLSITANCCTCYLTSLLSYWDRQCRGRDLERAYYCSTIIQSFYRINEHPTTTRLVDYRRQCRRRQGGRLPRARQFRHRMNSRQRSCPKPKSGLGATAAADECVRTWSVENHHHWKCYLFCFATWIDTQSLTRHWYTQYTSWLAIHFKKQHTKRRSTPDCTPSGLIRSISELGSWLKHTEC